MEHVEGNHYGYRGFEYKEVEADAENYSFLLDAYECFGWKEDDNISGTVGEVLKAERLAHGRKVKLRVKRDRKIMNKAELTRLQRNFEACVNEVEELEHSKTSKAAVWALSIGIIGTAFMAGSVFAITMIPPKILLCIILAVPAFIGWIIPYFIYKRTVASETKRIIPLIEAKYDEMHELCERGNKLLH